MHFFFTRKGVIRKDRKKENGVCVSTVVYNSTSVHVCAQLRKSVLLAHDDIVTNRMHFIQVLQIHVGFQLIQRP